MIDGVIIDSFNGVIGSSMHHGINPSFNAPSIHCFVDALRDCRCGITWIDESMSIQ